jgi:death-on-curing protein
MKSTKFPTIEEALYLHAKLIEQFGGFSGIRDMGLLESALGRPQSGYYSSLSLQAAALMHSMIKNHCFVDGNKRMGLALTATFLYMNGYILSATTNESERFILKMAADAKPVALDAVATWIEKRLKAF